MSSKRLLQKQGRYINPEQTCHFEFEGKIYQGFQGDTIASALLANNEWLLSRSFKYHRPRGPLSLAGQDANSLIQLAGEPNVLADKTAITEGLSCSGQNYSGSLKKDRDAILDKLGRFMPVGFYYRSFFKPFGSWEKWEKIIRKKAGLGVIDLDFEPEYYDKQYLFFDITIIGAGPAGMAAALKAADSGAKVLLVDENPQLGGSLSYHRFTANRASLEEYQQLSSAINQQPNITLLLNAVCNAWFADNYLPIIQNTRLFKVRSKECIIAAGSFEQHVAFRNNDLPGIVLCSAAERMMQHYAIQPGQKAVVLAGNDNALLTALDLAEFNVDVAAVVDMRSHGDENYIEQLTQLGIKYIPQSTVYEAIASKNKLHIKGVEIRSIIADGVVGTDSHYIECDLLCMSSGYVPTYQLLCQAGGQLAYDQQRANFTINNLPEHLHIAGSVNSIHELDAVIADGQRAAIDALRNLKLTQEPSTSVNCSAQVNYHWPIFKHPKGKEFIDFDEDLQIKDIINSVRYGYRDIQLVKRFSTVGMGPSQGRHSALPTARLIAKATDRTITETGVSTARPPFAPEKLAHNAGRIFAPYRRTAMHQRHIELGAQMMPAGLWRRPAYYGAACETAEQRKALVAAEALHVREKVGLIDVSTLGGLDIRGKDAAEFINRIYTGGFLKQGIGTTRYGIIVNEYGVIIDDGVSCRLAEDYFYVSSTTSAVDGVFREMKKWNAQWRLDVDILNTTSAYAAVNIAGPEARKVLEPLINDLDLSSQAFPYLAYREATIAGIPARILRVGFVGELGYEIHVPSRFGLALWDALMKAGAPFDIKPFGVEAQRLLRLEKGHIIIGQDTDGMTHPQEVRMNWAVNRNKPFYVGCRSVDILKNQPAKRQLVGFSLDANSPKPEEGHLVLDGDTITGVVTSCEYSAVLNRIIGLAYSAPSQKHVDSFLPIRVDGNIINATIEKLPFYDAPNQRQEL